jgi:murein L,D-transpeptidase YcbB/YkuD
MHDTPTKGLFNATQRTFSHGCMRVRDPLRLAEVLLGQDKGWDRARIATLAAAGAPQNNNVQLTHKFPVHVTYFTAFVDEKGATQFRPDIYGHEPRIQMGIDGKAHLIAKKKEELGPVRAEVVSRLIEARARPTTTSWIKQVFGF